MNTNKKMEPQRQGKIEDVQAASNAKFNVYTLYIAENESNSKRSLNYMSSQPLLRQQTYISNVYKEPRPSFVRGVPTLVNTRTDKRYEGTTCLEFIQGWKGDGQGNPQGKFGKSISKYFRHGVTGAGGMPPNNLLMFNRGFEDKTDLPPSTGQGNVPQTQEGSSVEGYMQRRQRITDQIKQSYQSQRGY
jgi:hypothetical protein